MFESFLSERNFETPNQWAGSLEFNDQVTSSVLSFHGFILAIGFGNGGVIMCDSETGMNRITFTPHSSSITALSFSRHGHNLAVGDSSGLIRVYRILSEEIVYSFNFQSAIHEIEFSISTLPMILVLEVSHALTLVNIDSGECATIAGEFVSVCWSREEIPNDKPPTIIAATAKDILLINSVSLEIIWRHEITTDRKGIARIEPSHKGDRLLVLEKSGSALLLSIDAQSVLTNFQDPTNYRKFTCACFDLDDQHIIFSSNQTASCVLTVFSVRDGGLITSVLQGPSEGVQQLLFHPLWPHIYTRGHASMRIWTPTYLNSWAKFVPGFDHVVANSLYDERESEFDEEEAVDEAARISRPSRIEPFAEIADLLFPSDEKFPDQLLYLPFDIDAAVRARALSEETVKPE
jgi:WD40 repeat protein